MAQITLTKGQDGRLTGITDADTRRWGRFLAAVKGLAYGDTVQAEFKLPRSPGFHKRHFVILAALFDAQEQFQDADKFRQWVQIGAGFCDILPGPKGVPCAVSKSIAWENLEDADFAEHHADVMRFVREPAFCRFLWGHLSDQAQGEMVEAILSEFER